MQLRKFTSLRFNPHSWVNNKNCYITTATLGSHLRRGRLPVKSAPYSWRAGISRGKLKGAITLTFPNGQR